MGAAKELRGVTCRKGCERESLGIARPLLFNRHVLEQLGNVRPQSG
jgi:hypothetical protein